MKKPKLSWSIGRALLLAGLSVVYAQTTPAVDAACYKSCTGTRDPQGNCISDSCNEGTSGKTECKVAGCVCEWGTDDCPPIIEG